MNSEPFPTSSHPPQGGIILFGKDLLTDVYICSKILINFDEIPKPPFFPSENPVPSSSTSRPEETYFRVQFEANYVKKRMK